ncbi:MAG: glycosyltransferase [Chloroflexi bacterium]|nr:MAG: glycosyltransferase [Chloroflexota bacterium]
MIVRALMDPRPAAIKSPLSESAQATAVLILFSDTGGGHRAAARALEQALLQLEPGIKVSKLDPLLGIDSSPKLVRQLVGLYSPIIQRSPVVWGALYHGFNNRPAFAAVRGVFGGRVRRIIATALRESDPDLILSVHPLLNHVSWQAIRRSGRPRGLVTVITDLVEFHLGWMSPRSDLTVVPTEGARREVLAAGVPEERVQLLGLPVDLRFRPPAPGEKAALRRRFGLDQKRFTILVSGGGEGSGKLLTQVRALAGRQSGDWQLIVVCGRNEKLQRRLSRVHFRIPARVLGFVDNMPELMRSVDLVVSKAGPGAIGEALATEVPILLTSYLPGQETPNVTFVTESGLGLYTPKPEQLLEAVRELAEPGSVRWQSMTERAAEISRPYASLDIASECLRVAARYRAAGQASR